MSIVSQPEAPTKSPAIDEQCITAFAHVQIMADADTGKPVFCVATDQQLSDFDEATLAQGLVAAEKLRADADRIVALANEYAATIAIPAFVEHHNIDLIETDLDGLIAVNPELAAGFRSWGARLKNGDLIVIVPERQDPVDRLAAIRDTVLDLQKQAAQA